MSTPSNLDGKPLRGKMTKLKSNIYNLLTCNRICGVCLENTDNLNHLDTVYNITCGEIASEISLGDVIGSTFGYKVTTLLPSCYFCDQCINVILKAYRMLQEIKANHQMLHHFSNKLNEQTKMILPDDVQSIVFVLDPDDAKLEHHNVKNGSNSSNDKDDESSENKLSKSKPKEVPTILKAEPKVMSISKPTLNVSEIVAKIKDQITLKKLKTETSCNNQTGSLKSSSEKPLSKHNTIFKPKAELTNKLKISKKANNKYYKCYLCESTFTGESELLKHSRKQCMQPGELVLKNLNSVNTTNKTEAIKKEVCDQCGKVVASNYLKKHKKLHEKMQKQCPVCAQFINKASYNRHMNSHSGLAKMRQCPHCDYQSKYGEALDAHINKEHLHTRPYDCDTCKKSFHSKLLLREHIRIHTRLKNLQCHLCGDRFAYKKSLVLHMRLHTGYAPYKCDLCDESFISASRRQTHVQSQHMGRTLQCDLCSKKFSLRTTLRCHMIRIHQKKEKGKST